MINVLHILNYLGSGGSEKYIYSLAKKLHKKSCNFHIAYSQEGNGKKQFEELGVRLIKLEMKSPADFIAALQLKRLCRKLSIDIIHTHFLRENYISVLSRFAGNKAKIVNTRHMLLENSKNVIISNRIFTGFNAAIIAVSNIVKERLIEEGINQRKIKMIYTGIDLDEWRRQGTVSPETQGEQRACQLDAVVCADRQMTLRDEFGISRDEIVITSVARFSPEKGHEFLLDAIKYFKDYIKENNISTGKYKFILTGDGELYGKIKEKAEALGLHNDIIFTGYRNDIKNILKSSDIFVSHSISESFGISVLEAIASGLPVIATDSGGVHEIISDKFKNGLLIDYGDKKKFTEGLLKLIKSRELRNLYASHGYEILQELFNLDKTVEETYNLYMNCLLK